jgi:3-oxoadipate enol-lactonase
MVPVDGGGLWADDSGGEGPPLVLLHPGVGDSRFWEPVLPALTAAYRVIRYDVPGVDHLPALREPDRVTRVISRTLARAGRW